MRNMSRKKPPATITMSTHKRAVWGWEKARDIKSCEEMFTRSNKEHVTEKLGNQ